MYLPLVGSRSTDLSVKEMINSVFYVSRVFFALTEIVISFSHFYVVPHPKVALYELDLVIVNVGFLAETCAVSGETVIHDWPLVIWYKLAFPKMFSMVNTFSAPIVRL